MSAVDLISLRLPSVTSAVGDLDRRNPHEGHPPSRRKPRHLVAEDLARDQILWRRTIRGHQLRLYHDIARAAVPARVDEAASRRVGRLHILEEDRRVVGRRALEKSVPPKGDLIEGPPASGERVERAGES